MKTVSRMFGKFALDLHEYIYAFIVHHYLSFVMGSVCGFGVCIIQVASVGRQVATASSSALDANCEIGPSIVSNPSFTSEGSRTFSKRRRRWLIYLAPDTPAVDYMKQDTEDDKDGVVDNPPI